MTEEIAKRDAYARDAQATVVRSEPGRIVLDRTVFYARGGGQPGDTGVIAWEGAETRVVDTIHEGEDVVHVIDGDPPPSGARVSAKIDWERRHLLMRTHTA